MAKGPIPGWGEPESQGTTGGAQQSPAEATVRAEQPLAGEKNQVAPVDSMAADLHDRKLGDFRILRRLGAGGMAEVYLAEQTTLHRNVAVKVLHKDRGADPGYLQRFKTEAMAAGSLNHPNIIQVLMIGEEDGYQYIAQEYVAGMNLREFLARKGPPELALALRIIRQAASALQAAHNAGIVHRDIKPENIMITRKGDVKIADFGLAQLAPGGERVNLTQTGVTMGTPLYMSPEQVNGSKLDHPTDIYSLGVTCYHMLSGHPPFRGETAISVAVQHLKQDAESLEKMRGDLPPLLCRIVHKMMAKPPERRYQSAQALLKDLKRVTEEDRREEQPTSEYEMHTFETADVPGDNFAVRTLKRIWFSPDRPFSRQLGVALILAVLIGGASAGLGWVTRVPNPLAAPLPPAPGVEKKDKAASQYYYALTLKDSVEAWQAVINFFPDPADRLYVNYARQQLATLLMARRRFDEAQQIFDECVLYGDADPHFRAFGLAGQAIVLNLRGDYNQSQRVLDRLQSPARPTGADPGAAAGESERKSPLLFDLLDEKMRQAVTETIHRNVEKLNTKMSQEWDDIFKTHEPAESAAGSDGAK